MRVKHAPTEFDGFFVDPTHDRTIHIGWEDDDVIHVDVFDSVRAATSAEHGECIVAVLINIVTGEVRKEF